MRLAHPSARPAVHAALDSAIEYASMARRSRHSNSRFTIQPDLYPRLLVDAGCSEARLAHDEPMLERARRRLCLCIKTRCTDDGDGVYYCAYSGGP